MKTRNTHKWIKKAARKPGWAWWHRLSIAAEADRLLRGQPGLYCESMAQLLTSLPPKTQTFFPLHLWIRPNHRIGPLLNVSTPVPPPPPSSVLQPPAPQTSQSCWLAWLILLPYLSLNSDHLRKVTLAFTFTKVKCGYQATGGGTCL